MLKKRILSLGILTAFLTGMAVFPTSIASAAPLGNGQTYYVATDGSDTNDGSLNAPFKTFQKAAETLQPGDTCIIRGGTYHETLTPRSGEAESPITYKAYEGEEVIISGANEVTGFEHHEGDIYKAPVQLTQGDKNQVFVNGDMGFNARWPNTATGKFYEGFAEVESGSNTTITDPKLAEFGDDFFKGATVWVNAGSRWTSQTSEVTDHTGDTITFNGLGLTDVQNTPAKGNPYYLFNVYGALDSENEWWYDEEEQMLYLYGDPTGKTVQVKARDTAINLDNVSYVNIDGIQVLGAGISGTNTSSITLNRVEANYAAHASTIENPYGTDVASIKLFGNNNTISNCEVAYSSATGVWISGDDNLLFNSKIHDTDYIGSYGACINVSGSGNVVSHNTAYNTGRDIIIFQSGDNCKIEYNDFSHSGMICADLGVFYTVATDGGGTEICYNWVHDNDSSGSRSGIYLDNGTSNWLVHHNVVWDAGTALQLNVPSNYIAAYNNTFIGNINQDFAWVFKTDTWGDRIINNIATGNIALKDETLARTNFGNIADPGFENADEHQYSLLANSQAIDAAEVIPGINDDYVGIAPDLGAYEYGQEPWTAGCNLESPPEMPQMPVELSAPRYSNLVENAGFETRGLEGWTVSGPVSKATPGAGHDPIQMDNGYTRTGYGSAKLTGSDAAVVAEPLDEDFSSGDLSAWSSDTFTGTQYSVQNEALQIENVEGVISECRVLYTGENYRDASYEVDVQVVNEDMGNQDLGLVARYMSSESYLYFSYAPWRAGTQETYQITRRVGTSYETLASAAGNVQLQPGQTYTMRVEMDGESLKWYVNGELQLQAEDPSPAAGKIGLGQYENKGAGVLLCDNVKVTPIESEEQTAEGSEASSNRGKLSKTIEGLNPNTTYTLTAWAKVEPGEELTMGVVGGESVTVSESAGGVWSRHQVEYTTQEETEMTICFEKTSNGSNAVYVDDVGVLEQEAPIVNDAEPQKVALNLTTASLSEKDALQLTAVVLPFNAKEQEVEWSTSDPEIATVSESGYVLGISEGTATITATVKGYPNISASCQIEVVPGIDYPVFDLAEDLADQDKWVTDGSPVFENGQVTLETMKTLASTAKYENGQLLHLRMKLDFDDPSDWYGVGIASKKPVELCMG
ncbi:MAG: Ig-like domain-containing protein [[Clostridium] leptum]